MRISPVGNKARFTLLEILVVLAIMTLVLTLVVPRIAVAPAGIAVRIARQKMQEPFRMAALSARAGGAEVTVTLDSDPYRFILSPGVRSDKGRVTERPVPKNVTFESLPDTPVMYTFFNNGGAAGPDLHYVCRDRQFILSVDKLNSRITVKEMDAK